MERYSQYIKSNVNWILSNINGGWLALAVFLSEYENSYKWNWKSLIFYNIWKVIYIFCIKSLQATAMLVGHMNHKHQFFRDWLSVHTDDGNLMQLSTWEDLIDYGCFLLFCLCLLYNLKPLQSPPSSVITSLFIHFTVHTGFQFLC